jgi:hypothetical protein
LGDGDGDDLQVDASFVVSDKQQPAVLTRDDVRLSGILHRLQARALPMRCLQGGALAGDVVELGLQRGQVHALELGWWGWGLVPPRAGFGEPHR